MTGFSADWLALREPADHAARNPQVAAAVRAHFAGRDAVSVVDYGCGAGSNLRGMVDLLPRRQNWVLVDHDPDLLTAARARLREWAEETQERADVLALSKKGRTLEVRFAQADLSGGIETALPSGVELVTAAALFDLCSPAWLEGLAGALAARRLPLYTVLTYDGQDRFDPPDRADQVMLDAFLADMRRDKGFGPAAGAEAPLLLTKGLEARGYRVETGDSPWALDAASPLAEALANGFAAAVGQTGRVPAVEIASWRALRRSGRWTTGHTDLFAAPG